MTQINIPVAAPVAKPSRRTEGSIASRKPRAAGKAGKPKGFLAITTPIVKVPRPTMLAEMAIGQTFTREGELCMRVLNTCYNGVKGKCAPEGEMWVVSLSNAKLTLATNTPVQVVDVEVSVVNEAK